MSDIEYIAKYWQDRATNETDPVLKDAYRRKAVEAGRKVFTKGKNPFVAASTDDKDKQDKKDQKAQDKAGKKNAPPWA